MAKQELDLVVNATIEEGSPITESFDAFWGDNAFITFQTSAGTLTATVQSSAITQDNPIEGWASGDVDNDITGTSVSTTSQGGLCGPIRTNQYQLTLTLTGAASATVSAVAIIS